MVTKKITEMMEKALPVDSHRAGEWRESVWLSCFEANRVRQGWLLVHIGATRIRR